MAFGLQLADARRDIGIQNVSGVCGDSSKFAQQINAVTRQLMKRGCWLGTEVPMRFCVEGPCITFPRHVGAVVGVRACGAVIPVKNNWYSIVGPNCGGSGDWLVMEDAGRFPTYNDITGGGKKVAYHVVKREDVGKKITIYGTDSVGQPLQHLNGSGVWQSGIILTAIAAGSNTNNPATTTGLVGRISSVVREATQGMTYLYEYDDATTLLRDLAAYEPGETNPMYRRMKLGSIGGIPSWTDANGRVMRSLECMVRLQYTPVISDSDFLLIDDLDALKFGVQALRKDEAAEADVAEVFWTKAIRELNMAERNSAPQSSISVRVRALGSGYSISNPH